MASTRGLYILALVLLSAAFLSDAWLFGSSSGSKGSRGSTRRAHDIDTGSGLTRLYNQRVVHSQGVRRPLGSGSRMYGSISHSGTVVTTADGSRWLVHKGDGYGGSGGDTVVTSARHMSGRWENIPGTSRDVQRSRVGDFVRAGGRDYSLIRDNCHNARCRMSRLP